MIHNTTTTTSTTTSNSHRINNGTQACAACKYQRRKCAPDCALAPYFPHDQQRQFLNAHKLFGVSNITKIIRNLSAPDKDLAMRTIMFQSDARAKDPVGGCYRIIRDLHHQIEYCKAELDLVLQQLALCKAQAYQAQLLQMTSDGEVIQTTMSSCNSDNNVNGSSNYHEDQYQALMMRCHYEDQGNDDVVVQDQYVPTVHDVQGNHDDEHDHHSDDHAYTWTLHADADDHDPCCGLIEAKIGGDSYDDERYYGSKFDEGHVDVSSCDLQREGLKFDTQHITELSEVVILKDSKVILDDKEDEPFHHHHHLHNNNNNHIPEHDLRSAATLFTLTN